MSVSESYSSWRQWQRGFIFQSQSWQFSWICWLIDLWKVEFCGGGMTERKSFDFGKTGRLNSTFRLPLTSLLWELKRPWHELGGCFGHWTVVDALGTSYLFLLGFPGGSVVKKLPANAGDSVQSLDGEIPWRKKWQPTPVFLPGKSHRQRSLVCYSPWGCKESDMT